MGHDIDSFPVGMMRNVIGESCSPVLDRIRGPNGGCDDLDAVGSKCILDAAPVLDAWKTGTEKAKLVESHEAMSEHDWVLRRLCIAALARESGKTFAMM